MKRKLLLLLIIIFVFPVFVFAENRNTEVIYNVKAEINFNNENIVINEQVNAGDKLLEPSHIDMDGYIFLGWFVGDKRWDFDNDVVTDNTTLVAKYKKIETVIENVTVVEDNYMDSTLVVAGDDINFSHEDKELIASGHDVVVWLEVSDANDTVSNNEVKLIEKFVKKKDLEVDSYFDIELFKEIEGISGSKENIEKTNNNVTVTVTLPEELRVFGRKYYILRIHDNVIDTVFSGYPTLDWKITFQTDSFSTYAFAHDEASTNMIVPNTADNVTILLIILFVSIVGIIYSFIHIKKLNYDRKEV